MKQSTYMRATLVMVDGGDKVVEHKLIIGLCDKIAAAGHFAKSLEDVPDDRPSEQEEWLAYAAWTAAKRQAGFKMPFESFLKSCIGLDTESGAVEESLGTTPA